MLRVFKPSGEAALAIPFSDFVDMVPIHEHPVRVLAIKRHLQRLIGQPRFKQRLVLLDGQVLLDDAVLQGPIDAQLILRPFEESSQDQIEQLQQAARDNNILALEQLLQRPQDPADLRLGDRTPLHVASLLGHLEVVRLLLEANADKDKATDVVGLTPLYAASQGGHVDVVRLLLEANAHQDKAQHDGTTPLYAASDEGHVDVVRVLLEAKADKDKARRGGATRLFVASKIGHLEVVRLLLEAKADKDKGTDDGLTPVSIASYRNHLEVVRLLREADLCNNLASTGSMTASSNLKRRRID